MDGTLAGKLLIASPAIEDPRFRQAVILLCAHNEDHAMGIILNKAVDDLPLPELLDQLGVERGLYQQTFSYLLSALAQLL